VINVHELDWPAEIVDPTPELFQLRKVNNSEVGDALSTTELPDAYVPDAHPCELVGDARTLPRVTLLESTRSCQQTRVKFAVICMMVFVVVNKIETLVPDAAPIQRLN
jgi:hypothetical protein